MIEKVFTSGLTWNPINVSIATWPYENWVEDPLGRLMLSLISLRISPRPAPWTISRFVIFVHRLQNNYKIKIPISLLVYFKLTCKLIIININ